MNFSKSKFAFISLLSSFLIISFKSPEGKTETEKSANVKGIDTSYIDKTYQPGNNFYMYANNGWLKKNAVPASESSWGTFNILRDDVYNKLKQILEIAASNSANIKGSSEQLIGDYFASGMDSVAIEKAGITPLKETLDKINSIKDKKELGALTGEMHKHFIFQLFNTDVSPDARKSDFEIVGLNQSGLGLPDRDYYSRQDEKSKMVREKYVAHIGKVLVLMGETEANSKKDAAAIMKLETSLASSSWTNVENRDPVKTYNKKSVKDFVAMCPEFNWADYFNAT